MPTSEFNNVQFSIDLFQTLVVARSETEVLVQFDELDARSVMRLKPGHATVRTAVVHDPVACRQACVPIRLAETS